MCRKGWRPIWPHNKRPSRPLCQPGPRIKSGAGPTRDPCHAHQPLLRATAWKVKAQRLAPFTNWKAGARPAAGAPSAKDGHAARLFAIDAKVFATLGATSLVHSWSETKATPHVDWLSFRNLRFKKNTLSMKLKELLLPFRKGAHIAQQIPRQTHFAHCS